MSDKTNNKMRNKKFKIEKLNISTVSSYKIFLFFSFYFFSCKGLISVDSPNNRIDANSVFSLDETAISMVTNIYTKLSQENRSFNGEGTLMNVSLFSGLSSDELVLFSSNQTSYYQLYTNSLTADNGINTWTSIYGKIFSINSAILGITESNTLSSGVQKQLLGEAKFMRAFCYFYLINLYGDVPLVLGTDPLVNANLPRTKKELVYNQVLDDLKSAQLLLSENYLSANFTGITNERVRPTKWAATALLARVYLFLHEYASAEDQSTMLINNSFFGLDTLNGVFLKNSNECIWQLQNVYNTGANTGDGQTFILSASGPNNYSYPVYLSDNIVNDFEIGDLRKDCWIDSVTTTSGIKYYFPYKYKSGASTANNMSVEYVMMLRLGEQFLIRAEARLQQGKITLASEDINKIRRRAGLSDIVLASKELGMNIILHERKVELFTEWGHRWLDLKRTNSIDNVMDSITKRKGGVWQSYDQLYPLSTSELLSDQNLEQNPGY